MIRVSFFDEWDDAVADGDDGTYEYVHDCNTRYVYVGRFLAIWNATEGVLFSSTKVVR